MSSPPPARRADTGTVRLGDRDIAGLLLCGDIRRKVRAALEEAGRALEETGRERPWRRRGGARPHTGRVASRLIPCVGAVIKDRGGRLLLIKRGHEPGAGLWSLPGGRIEPDETHDQAVAREVLEETGLRVECRRLLGTAELPGPAGAVIHVSDYLAVVTGGELAAGDDAADARWVTAADLECLPLTEGLAGYLSAWGAYPA